jgi:hypothetical protein
MTTIATLTTGMNVPELIVTRTIRRLDLMAQIAGIEPLSEIRKLCQNPDYRPSRTAGEEMHVFQLLDGWEPTSRLALVDDATRCVVLAALDGDDSNLRVLPANEIIASIEHGKD